MVTGLWYNQDLFFGYFLILRVQRTSMSFKSSLGVLEDAGDSWLMFGIFIRFYKFTGLWNIYDLNFGSLSWFWRCKGDPCPLSPHLGLWRTLEVTDWGLTSWSWFGYGHLSLIYPWSKFWLSIKILKVQRTSTSKKSSFGDFEDSGGSWLGFGILIYIWIWSLIFDSPIFQILALSLDFKGAKNIHVLKALIWGIEGHKFPE